MTLQRSYLMLKSTLLSLEKNIKVLRADWADAAFWPKAVQWAITGDSLITRASKTHREMAGLFMVRETPASGYASVTDMINFYTATDLQIKGPEDTNYWNAEFITDLNFKWMDPMGSYRILPFQAVERTTPS